MGRVTLKLEAPNLEPAYARAEAELKSPWSVLIQLIYVCDTYCRLPPLATFESVLLSEPRIYVKSGRIYVLIILNL